MDEPSASARAKARALPPPEEAEPPASVYSSWIPYSRAVSGLSVVADVAGFRSTLNNLRQEKGLSYDRLGRRARHFFGISRSGVYAVMTGRQPMDIHQVRSLLRMLDVSDQERDLWLAAFARISAPPPERGILQPAVVVNPRRRPAPVEDGVSAPVKKPSPAGWPTLVETRSRRPRKRPPDRVHGQVGWLLLPLVLLPSSAIAMTLSGMPVMSMLAVNLWFATMTFLRTCIIVKRPRRIHVRSSPIEEDLFSMDRKAAPPVIGL
ncbi:helix-turn-helix transcriptional regulator [Umezawaea sp.]|uniref:helix-turn-helix domain-containing protein n=1 Tax=Umezawaea sp. TaxID=1955258 RepID=UPI002ED69687